MENVAGQDQVMLFAPLLAWNGKVFQKELLQQFLVLKICT
jgi:hypothetical protein